MIEEVSEARLGALVLLNETEAEALSVIHGAAHARLLAFVGAVQPLDQANREKLANRLEAMADGLDDAKPSSLAGHQRDAVGAMIGEFRSLAAVLMQRPSSRRSSVSTDET
ncbi:MAG: hypothetical protein OXK77_10995 [Gemmatimonadota bacterium]|nr:hypothetical protein [Gemmatimonadota bacterium]MXV95925.1 hypothetical protein [Gemmatimonadota bacterium]MYE15353.1 hypothetical protein [Gemmatimonadota bacterium]